MSSYIVLFFGVVLFGYSLLLFRRSKSDQEGLKIYGMIAYIALTITVIALGMIIAPYLNSFGIGHIFFFVVIWKIIAALLLKPGFKNCGDDKR